MVELRGVQREHRAPLEQDVRAFRSTSQPPFRDLLADRDAELRVESALLQLQIHRLTSHGLPSGSSSRRAKVVAAVLHRDPRRKLPGQALLNMQRGVTAVPVSAPVARARVLEAVARLVGDEVAEAELQREAPRGEVDPRQQRDLHHVNNPQAQLADHESAGTVTRAPAERPQTGFASVSARFFGRRTRARRLPCRTSRHTCRPSTCRCCSGAAHSRPSAAQTQPHARSGVSTRMSPTQD